MDMAKYVAVGVLAVIVLAAVTYEAPPDPKSAGGPQVTGTLGGEGGEPSGPEGTGSVAATVERGAQSGTTLPAASPAPVTTAVASPVSEPVREELLSYTIKAGQTLSDVAGELLGSRGRWREIYEQNKDKIPDPNRVKSGITVVFPAARRNGTSGATGGGPTQVAHTGGTSAGGTPCPVGGGDGRSYVVKQGDTLYSIAKRELGKSSRWKEIAELNGIDGSSLVAGKTISLPR